MFHKMPFILLAIIASIILLDPILPFVVKQFLYSISLTIKSFIIVLLPFIIFGLLFKAAVLLAKNAPKIIIIIIFLVCFSNFISTFLSHFIGEWVYDFNLSILIPKNTTTLPTLWVFELPKFFANDKAMFAGIIIGMVASKLFPQKSIMIANIIERFITRILRGFLYFIPVFVVGFIVELQYEGSIKLIIEDYTLIFLIIACAQFGYILFLYFLLSNFHVKELFLNIKNMIPAAISGFSSMSSATAMPLTIIGAKNNAHNKELISSVIPATVNIHLVGDCFAIPIFAYAILKSFGIPEPSLLNYLIFTGYFVLAKFSVAAIPGGGIIVMLPILENYLNFNPAMMSMITALYVLFDPVITCVNILGNGAFAKIIDKLFFYFRK